VDITVYLPDDIGTWAKEEGLNLSATLRAEIEAERERRKARAEITAEGFERIETYDAMRERDVAFQGHSIGTDPDRGAEAYLTPKGSIAVVGEGGVSDDQLLGIYVSFGQFASAGYAYDFVSEVAAALGEEAPVMVLDI
jgi:post-segregation antitoxin (ccd killing protein)